MTNKLVTLLFATLLMADDNNISLENNSTNIDNNLTVVEIVADPNPKVYAALGDVVYDNVASIQKLQHFSKYSNQIEKINNYVDDVNKTKQTGYKIEKGDKSISKGDYLKEIRALSKRNDDFKREAISLYKSAITNKDNIFFYEIINSGFLDSVKYKSEIMDYYLENSTDIATEGAIQSYLDEDELLKKQADASKKRIVTRRQIQDANIRRIRQNDKNKEAKIQQQLEDELTQKRNNILDNQRKDLSR